MKQPIWTKNEYLHWFSVQLQNAPKPIAYSLRRLDEGLEDDTLVFRNVISEANKKDEWAQSLSH